MKVAPVIGALPEGSWELVHTGQHYDAKMSHAFFQDLAIPEPDVSLGVGSGTHGEQTGRVLIAYEEHLMSSRPDAVVVVGDVNSTLGAALAASKLNVPVAHVEAGLRSRDWTMPEEVNRVLTDRLSRWLFTPSADGDENLIAEGIDETRIHLVGNVMIDTLLRLLPSARDRRERVEARFGVSGSPYGVVTLHRPSNVDDAESVKKLLGGLARVSDVLPLVFPVHPRARAHFIENGYEGDERIRLSDPLGYLDFLALLDGSSLVITDSGGIQEETSVLGVPCLTVRDNTERPITCELGTNHLVGSDPDAMVHAAAAVLDKSWGPANIPHWDGNAGERIASILTDDLGLG